MLKTNLSKTALCSLLSFLFMANRNSGTAQSSNAFIQVSNTSQRQIKPTLFDTGVSDVTHVSVTSDAEILVEAKEPQIQLNPKAVTYVAHYLKENHEMLVKIKGRSAPYFKIIESLFLKNNLPLELKYLAVIESRLKATAVSHAGAVGPWQLMPQTAKALGLKITRNYDERTHYYKSTAAVCKYLKDLYAEYGDWLLVIAAYNAGPGRVNKAIKQAGSRNFWYLQQYLPAETRGHVKRFIGAHYYFEQCGSETTLTKAETLAYRKALAVYKESLEKMNEATNVNESEETISGDEVVLD